MGWGKRDDRAALYPKIMAVAAVPGYEDDDRIVCEMRGFIVGLYDQVAAHTTDYVVDWGTVRTIAGPTRVSELVELSVKLQLLEMCLDVRGLKAVRMIDDPNFVHVRSRAEVEWEQQQRNDTNNPGLAGPVRRRDGDNCRYCGQPVYWRGQKSPRSASLDHRNPGEPATVETVVVACQKCNSELRRHKGEELEQLRPAPAAPRYGKVTALYLAENGYLVLDERVRLYLNDPTVKRPYLVHDGDTLVCGSEIEERGDFDGQRPTEGTAPTASDPAPKPDTAAPAPQSQAPPESHPRPLSRESPGSGRVGSGTGSRSEPHHAGTGTPGRAGTDPPHRNPSRRRRSRRGRRPPPPQEGTTS